MMLLTLIPINGEYQEFLLKGHLSFNPQPVTLTTSLFILLLFSTLAAVRSAIKGANLKPVDALRYE